jgi:hypothetical protein
VGQTPKLRFASGPMVTLFKVNIGGLATYHTAASELVHNRSLSLLAVQTQGD